MDSFIGVPILILGGLTTFFSIPIFASMESDYIASHEKIRGTTEYNNKIESIKKTRNITFAVFLVLTIIGFIISLPGFKSSPTRTLTTCDYCGKSSEYSYTVGRQELCYSCYQLYKQGNR